MTINKFHTIGGFMPNTASIISAIKASKFYVGFHDILNEEKVVSGELSTLLVSGVEIGPDTQDEGRYYLAFRDRAHNVGYMHMRVDEAHGLLFEVDDQSHRDFLRLCDTSHGLEAVTMLYALSLVAEQSNHSAANSHANSQAQIDVGTQLTPAILEEKPANRRRSLTL